VIELLFTNIIYVAYRLIVSGPIVKLLNKYLPFYLAVFIMAQLSFAYDTVVFGYYFSAVELPSLIEYLKSNVMYTLRVIAAWWVIKQLWNKLGNYWLAVFIGAELTFIFDYFIFGNLFT
jgi:hypothetical protein